MSPNSFSNTDCQCATHWQISESRPLTAALRQKHARIGLAVHHLEAAGRCLLSAGELDRHAVTCHMVDKLGEAWQKQKALIDRSEISPDDVEMELEALAAGVSLCQPLAGNES